MSEFTCAKEEVHELRIDKTEKDIAGIGIRTSKNEHDIINLEKATALSEQRFQTLLTQLSEVPQTMIEMKETMIAMQNENKIMMMTIQNDNKETHSEVNNLKSKILNLENSILMSKKEHEDKIKLLEEKIEQNEDRNKFDVMQFITKTVIPTLIGGGIVYFITQLIK